MKTTKVKNNESIVYLYIIKTSNLRNYYKIGITNNINKRRNELERQSPFELEFLETFSFPSRKKAKEIETSLHNNFKHYNIKKRGKKTEWFKFPSDMVALCKVKSWLNILESSGLLEKTI